MEEEKTLPTAESNETPQNEEKVKTMWQIQKENWYDKIPFDLKQMNLIVIVCWIALILAMVVIALDAMDIFNPFGY